jgi:hypothetical protein
MYKSAMNILSEEDKNLPQVNLKFLIEDNKYDSHFAKGNRNTSWRAAADC